MRRSGVYHGGDLRGGKRGGGFERRVCGIRGVLGGEVLEKGDIVAVGRRGGVGGGDDGAVFFERGGEGRIGRVLGRDGLGRCISMRG